ILALKLYAALQPDAADEARRELGWAASLHELGMTVSHHDHHRHSAYLLANVDAAGFSQSQQRRLAALVLGQRGGLRLAVLLCHARQSPAAEALTLSVQGRLATLACSPGWAASHPRSMYLLTE